MTTDTPSLRIDSPNTKMYSVRSTPTEENTDNVAIGSMEEMREPKRRHSVRGSVYLKQKEEILLHSMNVESHAMMNSQSHAQHGCMTTCTL